MGRARARRVAIVGGGPSGAALADLARARRGATSRFFTRGKRPPIIVGESLVPAVVPFLRDLGVEDEVAEYSTYKPGATFVFHPDRRRSASASPRRAARARPTRTTCRATASTRRCSRRRCARARCGSITRRGSSACRTASGSASTPRRTRSREQALGGAPDLIVDATGRARTIARLLELPTRRGRAQGHRAARALHRRASSCCPATCTPTGSTHGWGWRIPLPGTRLGRRRDPVRAPRLLRQQRRGAVRQLPAPRRVRAPLGREGRAHHAGGALHELPAARDARRRRRLGAGRRRVRLRRPGLLERPPDRVRRRARARATRSSPARRARSALTRRARSATWTTGRGSSTRTTAGGCSRCSRWAST